MYPDRRRARALLGMVVVASITAGLMSPAAAEPTPAALPAPPDSSSPPPDSSSPVEPVAAKTTADDPDPASAGPTTTTPSTTTTTAPPFPADVWQRFDQVIADQLTGGGDRAASVAVSVDGQLVHATGFGVRAPGEPFDPTTSTDRFRIASISKLITATVVLQLVDQGQLTLDDPVGWRLAGLVGVRPADDIVAAITVRQLLSHTSGFPDYRSQFFGDQFQSCEQAAAYGLARTVAHQPGTTHDYSNLNYCLLGLLVADATGLTYEAAVEAMLLQPLGITGMRTVATFDPNPDEVVHDTGAGRTFLESLGGAGVWVATPSDVVRILDSLDVTAPGWHPLPAGLAELMHQPVDVRYPEPEERRYGLGLIVYPDGTWGHTGTVENTRAMVVHRRDGITWCLLISGPTPESTEDLRAVFDRALAAAGLDGT